MRSDRSLATHKPKLIEANTIYLMASLNNLLCATILCTIILINLSCCYGQSKQEQQDMLLFVFGDSVFDAGNNQYLNNKTHPETSWPYGMNFNNHSTGRFSDGRIVPDFIAQYAKLNLIPPYLEPGANFTDGANFASAGAAVLNTSEAQGEMNLRKQLNYFEDFVNNLTQKVGEEEAQKVLRSSVFLFSIGENDYFHYNEDYPDSTLAERKAFVDMVIGNLTNGIKELYDIGGRKFGFQNVGDLGCRPQVKAMYPELNGKCATNFSMHANMHNKALSNALAKFESELPGFKYALFDFYHVIGDMMENPAEYGFKEGKVACCGSGLYNGEACGKEPFRLCSNAFVYVFFDGSHNTEATNRQLADLLWNGPGTVTGPHNLKQLFETPYLQIM